MEAGMILVTGGTGSSGSEIVEALASKGVKFRMLARNPAKVAVREQGVEIVAGDLAQPRTLAEALKGIDRVLLLAPPVPNQVELESNVVDAAKNAAVRHVVKFSAMTADPNSASRFPRAHGHVEQKIRASGLPWTFLRPTFFMQNLLSMSGMIKGGTIFQPAGTSKAAFVDTRDIAAVAVSALTEPGHEAKAYDITGPELLTYEDVAATFSRVLGRTIKYQDIPPSAARQAMLGMGIPEWSADGINELMDQMRSGAYATVTNVVEQVGHKKPTTLEQFVRENAAAF
jgi:uncharacterized protein YbjT (DUF2867 family)